MIDRTLAPADGDDLIVQNMKRDGATDSAIGADTFHITDVACFDNRQRDWFVC